MAIKAPKQLRDVMKMSLVEKESSETIKSLWTDYHSEKAQCLSMVIDKQNSNILQNNMAASQMFIFPLHRQSGHVMLLSQNQSQSKQYQQQGLQPNSPNTMSVGDSLSISGRDSSENATVLFALLEDYKRNGFLSSPVLILNIFREVIEKKGVALLRGDIVDTGMTKGEAQLLLKRFMMFYLTPELYTDHVHPFNNNPESFNYDSYMNLLKPESR